MDLFCSFCGKSQKAVRKLIAGPGVYICDNCVCLCCCLLNEQLGVGQWGDAESWALNEEIIRKQSGAERVKRFSANLAKGAG